MREDKSLLLKSAMSYGLFLGAFWVIKYLFFVGGISSALLAMGYWVLTPLTLIFVYFITRKYRYNIGGQIGFFHAWQFGVLLYFFAGIVVSPAHYVFYQYYAPPNFIAGSMDQVVELLKNSDLGNQMKDSIEKMIVPTPIQMAIQGVFNNTFYGILFSIPIAYLVSRTRLRKDSQKNNQA